MNEQLQKELQIKLKEEEHALLDELNSIGTQNPDNPSDWMARPDDTSTNKSADPNSRADSVEDYENNEAIVSRLEVRLSEVRLALAKIQEGGYGVCEISGEEIEEDRLKANPAARTNKAHMNDK